MNVKRLSITILAAGILCSIDVHAVTIRASGFIFTPDEVTVQPGDTVRFDIGSFHNAVEVSEETWLAGDTTSNGGFRLPFGGGKVVFDEEGTYYFVCQPHASLGMKGIIHVEIPSSVADENLPEDPQLFVYPNPASDVIKLGFNVVNPGEVEIYLADLSGRTIQTLIDSHYNSGKYTEVFSVGNIEQGRYIIYIRTNSGTKAITIVKL